MAPDNPGFLLLAEICLAWAFVTYVLFGNEPIFDASGNRARRTIEDRLKTRRVLQGAGRIAAARGVAMVIVMLLILGVTHPGSWVMAALLGGATWLTTIARWETGTSAVLDKYSKRVVAECELAAAVVIVALSAAASTWLQLDDRALRIHTPFNTTHPAIVISCVAVIIYVVWGGTHIVRGILEKSGATPHVSRDAIDEAEYARGRVIGALERVLLSILTIGANYGALGFLAAAKGLIRSKQLEKHDFAEYFLVGTFASVLVAIGGGLVMRWLISYW
ncbi:MAG: hypothetical protein ABJB95_11830 [Gemmatimonadales bacterium]